MGLGFGQCLTLPYRGVHRLIFFHLVMGRERRARFARRVVIRPSRSVPRGEAHSTLRRRLCLMKLDGRERLSMDYLLLLWHLAHFKRMCPDPAHATL